MEYCVLLGKPPTEVDLTEYMGLDIDTLRSATWRYSSSTKGMLIQAHIDQNNKDIAVITTITCYFSKEGYAYFNGALPFGIDPLKTLSKNRAILMNKAGFKDLSIVKELGLGDLIEFDATIADKRVYLSALYLEDDKGKAQKQMYSLEFSLLRPE